ncbi:MAG: OmpH family outer membrane protein, partial [Gammaproteobacteria bacterium]|nr:OmpH family outer membrane protein [Gammaproteobacteria bacterium]
MKKIAMLVAVVFAMCSVSAFADGVGVVDMKTIFSTSPKVKQIKADLTKQFEPQKNKLTTM